MAGGSSSKVEGRGVFQQISQASTASTATAQKQWSHAN